MCGVMTVDSIIKDIVTLLILKGSQINFFPYTNNKGFQILVNIVKGYSN